MTLSAKHVIQIQEMLAICLIQLLVPVDNAMEMEHVVNYFLCGMYFVVPFFIFLFLVSGKKKEHICRWEKLEFKKKKTLTVKKLLEMKRIILTP